MKIKYRIEGPDTEGLLEGSEVVPATGDFLILKGSPYTVVAREIHCSNGSIDGVTVIIREGTGQLRQ